MDKIITTFKSFLNALSLGEIKSLRKDYANIIKCASFDNPLTLDIKLINEGLNITYPIEKTISYVKDFFGLSDKQIFAEKNCNGIDNIIVFVPVVANNKSEMTHAMETCGYFLAVERMNKNGTWSIMQFEAKHLKNISSEIHQKCKFLVHLTPMYNLGKIRAIGFSPRAKNNIFKYPARVYFFKDSLDIDAILGIGRNMYYANNSLGNNGKFAVILVDVSKIPEQVKFYEDPDAYDAIYTNENIKPDVILAVKEIDFSK